MSAPSMNFDVIFRSTVERVNALVPHGVASTPAASMRRCADVHDIQEYKK